MKEFGAREIVKRRHNIKVPLHHGHFFVLKHLKQFTHTQISRYLKPNMQVADVGCGGQPLRALIESYEANYTGIDVIQNDKGSVDIIAEISAIPLLSESFDFIVCTEVLEHCFDPLKAIQELYRLLKPSGVLLITTPFMFPLHEVPYDFSRITPFYMKYWFPKIGFSEPEIIQLGGNELEVIATVWGHIWAPRKKCLLLRAIFALLRLIMNMGVLIISKLLDPFLEREYFLNTACVVVKPGHEC